MKTLIGRWGNNRLKSSRQSQGLTLVELLVALAIAGILVGVVAFTLRTTLDTYHYLQDDIFMEKILDEALQIASDGDFEAYGIKDAFEILKAGPATLTFVPLWVDDAHIVKSTGNKPQEFALSRPFKAGSSLPIGEVLGKGKKGSAWQQIPLTFLLGEKDGSAKVKDRVIFNQPVPVGSKARFIFHPDSSDYPETTMTINLSENKLVRIYRNKAEYVPKYDVRNVSLDHLKFQFFDNNNSEILPDPLKGFIPDEQIPNITAVKLNLKARLGNKSKKGSVFINLRNTRSSGAGLIIRKGTTIKIPNSREVRAFSLVNVMGVKRKGQIKLEAKSNLGRSWRVTIDLDYKDDLPILKKYAVDYPAGRTVYSEQINLTTNLPLNLLTLGRDGRYDYDFDKDVNNVVDLEGEVELNVLRMDAAGAAIFIRP